MLLLLSLSKNLFNSSNYVARREEAKESFNSLLNLNKIKRKYS